jgi:Ca2+-transporting ATPase
MLPDQKLELIEIFQNNNFVVGMIGDGINDTPALKRADIGIAMGIRGTEAAKEVADVILKDDKFASIELAIYQGRTIFENIRKFVVYLISSNLAEIVSVALVSVSSLPLPILPLQILFLNLVTDIFPALAIGMSKGDDSIMTYPPRQADEPIMTRTHWVNTLIYGLSISIAVISITLYASMLNYSDAKINNLAFYTLVGAQLLNVFNLPSSKQSFLHNEITHNRWIWLAILFSTILVIAAYSWTVTRNVLSLVPLQMQDLLMISLFSLGSLLMAQFIKSILVLRGQRLEIQHRPF